MAKKATAKKKTAEKSNTTLRSDEFISWITMPRTLAKRLQMAAASLQLPVSDFGRVALCDLMLKVERNRTSPDQARRLAEFFGVEIDRKRNRYTTRPR